MDETGLTAWARAHLDPRGSVTGLRRLSGHGGETFAFDVVTPTDVLPLVIRLAPIGVPRKGNTDVLRQVPLLDALRRAGLAVAPVVAAVSDDCWFGTDALVQRRIDGRPLSLFPPAAAALARPVADHLREAAGFLVELHALDHHAALPGWEEAQHCEQVVDQWSRLISRQPEPVWAELATELAGRLRATCPTTARIGICHGDFQTNNVLYDDSGLLVGVVDWELAHIGPTALDVMWLAMMADPDCWGPPHRESLLVTADPADVLRWYADAGGVVPDPDWYLALACFRYGVICGYNVRLHRTGRRVDDFNGDLAGTVPVLLARGLDALRTH